MEEAVASSSSLRGLWVVVIGLLIAGPAAAGLVSSRRDAMPRIALATITASAATAAEAKTVTVTATSETRMSGQQPFVVHTSTWFDNEAKAGRFTATYPGAPGAELDGVLAADKIFLRLPEAARQSVGGKLWVTTNPTTHADAGAANPARTGTQLLEDLAGAEGKVEVKGTEDVKGIRTTHYRVDVDVRHLRERSRRAPAGLVKPGAGGSAPEAKILSSPADVWLDRDGLPRRARMVMTIDVGGTKVVNTTDSYYEYDQPVIVWVPAADQVHEVETLADAFKLLFDPTVRASGSAP